MSAAGLTATEIYGAIEQSLGDGGYQRIRPSRLPSKWPAAGRAYEDIYGVIGVFSFDTVESLVVGWLESQSHLVDLISAHMTKDEAKAWDGYLVLVSPSIPSLDASDAITAVRRDTTRVRKLVLTGADLTAVSAVADALAPLLPLEADIPQEVPGSPFGALPALLERRGVGKDLTNRVIAAYEAGDSILRSTYGARRIE